MVPLVTVISASSLNEPVAVARNVTRYLFDIDTLMKGVEICDDINLVPTRFC